MIIINETEIDKEYFCVYCHLVMVAFCEILIVHVPYLFKLKHPLK